MSTETQVAPVAETQNTAAETTQKPDVVEPGSTDSEALAGDESEAKPEKSAEQKELERLRRQLTKRDRTQGKLYQELQTTRQQLEQFSQAGEPEEKQQDPRKLAEEMVKARDVLERSNKVAKEGQTKFKDFNQSLERVVEEVGELFDPTGTRPTAIGEAILESDDPASLIDFLGKNPDLAAELEGLSPTKLGRRIERIEAQMSTQTAKPVSKASEPINPIKGGAGSVVKTLETMSQSEYEAYRSKNGARWAR